MAQDEEPDPPHGQVIATLEAEIAELELKLSAAERHADRVDSRFMGVFGGTR